MKPFVAYFGHHKCGSNWIQRIMRRTANQLALRYERLNWPAEFGDNLAEWLEANEPGCVSWVNADYTCLSGLDFKAFHVVRDPRDVLVSAYFSHLKTHPTEDWPELVDFRRKLQGVSKEEGLLLEFGFFTGEVFSRQRHWNLDDDRIRTVRLEDITRDEIGQIRDVFEFLGLFEMGLEDKRFLRTMALFNFKELSGGRSPGEEDPDHHYRKGVHGDWRNHFSERVTDAFKTDYNDLLIKYGYEENEDW